TRDRLGATAQRDLGLAVPERVEGVADRVVAGRARGRDRARVRVGDGQLAGDRGGERRRAGLGDQVRVEVLRAVRQGRGGELVEFVAAAFGSADRDVAVFEVVFGQVRVGDRHPARRGGELGGPAQPARRYISEPARRVGGGDRAAVGMLKAGCVEGGQL